MDPISVLIVLAALWSAMLIVGVGMVYYCLWKAHKEETSPRSLSPHLKEAALAVSKMGEISDCVSVEVECCQEEDASASGLQTCASPIPALRYLGLQCSELSKPGDKEDVTRISVEPCLIQADTEDRAEKGGQLEKQDTVAVLRLEDMEGIPDEGNDAVVTFTPTSGVTIQNVSPMYGPPSSLPPVVD